MHIVDLGQEHKRLVCVCLEDWSEEAAEAGPKRTEWVERMLPLGLRVKLALDDEGTVGGMIQYLPIEHSFVRGEDLYVVHCVWVHGHDEGRGDFQGQGMGAALLAAAEEDVRSVGANGLVAWGLWLPFWMKASWFRKHGYVAVDRQGTAVLLWKAFSDQAVAPRWYESRAKLPELTSGLVTVTAFTNGWCMSQNLVYERAQRAAAAWGDRVVFREVDTSDRAVIAEFGYSDAVFVNHEQLRSGPPATYEKVERVLRKHLSKL